MIIIGIDNGTSGAITIMEDGKIVLHRNTPIFNQQSYTKEKNRISRVMTSALKIWLEDSGCVEIDKVKCYIERPMINPMRFKASISAARALEATLIVLEELGIPYEYIDSKEWQKELLPPSLVGKKKKTDKDKKDLKQVALDIARRLFPKTNIVNADSILIAEYCRRKNMDGIRRK